MKIIYNQDQSFKQFNYHKLQCPQKQIIKDFIHKKRVSGRREHEKKQLEKFQLKNLVRKAKVELLIKNFIRKIQRSKVHNTVPSGIKFQDDSQRGNLLNRIINFLSITEGVQLSPIMLTIWSFINIIQITTIVIIYSINIAFPQTENQSQFIAARVFSVILYTIDMTLNFTTKRFQIGGQKKNLKEIIIFYLKNQFTPDFFSIAFFPLSSFFNASDITSILMLIALFKLKNNMKKFQSYQYIYVKNNSKQQYYSLIKVFLLNFSIGHLLSILLNLMANASEGQENWYSKLNINDAPWHQKYVWGYYWGTNIMLTVGFGDLCATNKTEAAYLIFIETISCITLAYNISCVGSIIGQIKAQNDQKKTKLKYFNRMCKQNKISQELSQKINNFIEESYLLKQQFQIQKFEDVLNSLPKSMQSEYRKQANQSLFSVGFFNSFNTKTISNLAQLVISKVAHPQQIIQKRGQMQLFCILQKGSLGLTCRNSSKSILNGNIISVFQILKEQDPKILSLGFIKRKTLMYDIKCLTYSIYYYLTYEQLIKILKTCEMDYQYFHYMKDKDEIILGSNEINKCKVCADDYHSLFQCPKYHYIPLKQLVIANYIKKQVDYINYRNDNFQQRCYKYYRTLYYIKPTQKSQQSYLKNHFDQDQIRQINNMKKFYYKKLKSKQTQNKQQKQLSTKKQNFTFLKKQFDKIEDILIKVSSSLTVIDYWTVQCDLATNFGYYFKEFNPSRLINFKKYSKKSNKQFSFGGYKFKNNPYRPIDKQKRRKSIFQTVKDGKNTIMQIPDSLSTYYFH